jgi:hypothetical protein
VRALRLRDRVEQQPGRFRADLLVGDGDRRQRWGELVEEGMSLNPTTLISSGQEIGRSAKTS